MTTGKARIWAENNPGPAWSRIPVRRIWRFKVPHGNGYIHGITLTWPAAMAATQRHLEDAQ